MCNEGANEKAIALIEAKILSRSAGRTLSGPRANTCRWCGPKRRHVRAPRSSFATGLQTNQKQRRRGLAVKSWLRGDGQVHSSPLARPAPVQGKVRDYSLRMATRGSTRTARSAGTPHAASATRINRAETVTKVPKSLGRTS